MENASPQEAYEVVLADLRSQKARIEQAIAIIEALRTGGLSTIHNDVPGMRHAPETKADNRPDLGPGAFLGMTIHDAAKKLLATRRQQLPTSEIVQELERGGLVLTSADKLNTVGSVLLRRFNTTGDIVRVARGIWGLQEWYPGRKFPGSKTKAEDASKGEEAPAEEAAPESSVGDEAGTQPDKPTAAPAAWPHFTDYRE